MATIGWKMLKLSAIVGSVPAVAVGLGYRMRAVQASENNGIGGKRIYTATELPLYRTPGPSFDIESKVMDPPYPRNAFEEQIGVVRKQVQDFLSQFEETYDTLVDKSKIGIEHSKATLDYVQNNPGELPRVIFIAVAGMGGVVLGYRGGPLRKLTYGTVAALSSAALCYPKKTVELSHQAKDQAKAYWKEYVGEDAMEKYWPFPKMSLGKKMIEMYNEFKNPTETKKDLIVATPTSKPPEKVSNTTAPAKEPQKPSTLKGPNYSNNQPQKINHYRTSSVSPTRQPDKDNQSKKTEKEGQKKTTEKKDQKSGLKLKPSDRVIVEVKEIKPIAEDKPLPKIVTGDPGQSTPEDKDMYSTRSW